MHTQMRQSGYVIDRYVIIKLEDNKLE